MPMFCAVVGCSNRSNRETDKKYYRIPSIIRKKGPDLEKLSKNRRGKWVKALCRKDFKPNDEKKIDSLKVCSDHFITGICLTLNLKFDFKFYKEK